MLRWQQETSESIIAAAFSPRLTCFASRRDKVDIEIDEEVCIDQSEKLTLEFLSDRTLIHRLSASNRTMTMMISKRRRRSNRVSRLTLAFRSHHHGLITIML